MAEPLTTCEFIVGCGERCPEVFTRIAEDSAIVVTRAKSSQLPYEYNQGLTFGYGTGICELGSVAHYDFIPPTTVFDSCPNAVAIQGLAKSIATNPGVIINSQLL
jgi:hypothetical protein